MNRPFNMPDEFVDGFAKAGASLWRSLGRTANGESDGAAVNSPLGSPGRIAELQVDYLNGLYQLSEHIIRSAAGGQSKGVVESPRGDRRFNVDQPARVYTTRGQVWSASIVDISRRGMQLVLDGQLPIGVPVRVAWNG